MRYAIAEPRREEFNAHKDIRIDHTKDIVEVPNNMNIQNMRAKRYRGSLIAS